MESDGNIAKISFEPEVMFLTKVILMLCKKLHCMKFVGRMICILKEENRIHLSL